MATAKSAPTEPRRRFGRRPAPAAAPNPRDIPDGDGNVFGGESFADRIAEGSTPEPQQPATPARSPRSSVDDEW